MNKMESVFIGYMKGLAVISMAVLYLLSACTGGNTKAIADPETIVSDTGKAELVFVDYEHDFGKVEEGEKVSYVFRFENKGTANLVIKSASATCGCTVPRFDKRPVKPGESGMLEVVFNTAGREGRQTKMITVVSNSSKPEMLLRISAEIVTNIN